MSNEKRSDSWIGQLNELESLPGEASFNKTAAWGRLHQRLEEKKHQKRAIWYWVAAACLLIGAAVPFVRTQTPDRQVQVGDQRQGLQPAGTPQGTGAGAIVNTPALTNPSATPGTTNTPAIVNTPTVINAAASLSKALAKEIPVTQKQLAITRDKHVIIPAVAVMPITKGNIAVYGDSMQSQTVATVVTPHKMRVVHINDVGGDVIGNAYVYPEHKQFKIAISGPAGFASQVVSEKTVKTDLSPKN